MTPPNPFVLILFLLHPALSCIPNLRYIPPTWVNLDCSQCSPGGGAIVTAMHTFLAVWGPAPPCCRRKDAFIEKTGGVLRSSYRCGRKGLRPTKTVVESEIKKFQAEKLFDNEDLLEEDLLDKEDLLDNEDLFDIEDLVDEEHMLGGNSVMKRTLSPDLEQGGLRSGVGENSTKEASQEQESKRKKKKDGFRVVGGKVAYENEVPWQVSLLKADNSWAGCGAVLVSCDPIIVLTGAHCVADSQVRLPVQEIIVHPEYNLVNLHIRKKRKRQHRFFIPFNLTAVENDIAILKVNSSGTEVCKERVIWPACLPSKSADYSKSSATLLTGWGRITEGGPWSPKLRKIRIPIVSDAECDRNVFHYNFPAVQNIFTLSDSQLCAGDIKSGQGPCQGDSGGPLVAREETLDGQKDPWALVGLVSWRTAPSGPGGGCDGPTYTVFTEVSKYLDWVADQFGMVVDAP